jgi:hypothetical protein
MGISHSKEFIHVNLSYDELPRKYGRESVRHRALKKVAFQMLKELGDPNPQYEYAYCDVYSEKFRIVIECGLTNIFKILEVFFQWHMADEVWVLDYPNKDGFSELVKFKKG